MPARTSCSSESRFHRGSEWGMQYLEPSPQSWHLTYLRGNLPSTFSVEAGALRSSTQRRNQPISRNAKFASSALLFAGDHTQGVRQGWLGPFYPSPYAYWEVATGIRLHPRSANFRASCRVSLLPSRDGCRRLDPG